MKQNIGSRVKQVCQFFGVSDVHRASTRILVPDYPQARSDVFFTASDYAHLESGGRVQQEGNRFSGDVRHLLARQPAPHAKYCGPGIRLEAEGFLQSTLGRRPGESTVCTSL